MTVHPTPRLGDPAPQLVLPDENGASFALRSLEGRPVLVSFLSHAA